MSHKTIPTKLTNEIEKINMLLNNINQSELSPLIVEKLNYKIDIIFDLINSLSHTARFEYRESIELFKKLLAKYVVYLDHDKKNIKKQLLEIIMNFQAQKTYKLNINIR